MHCLWGLVHSHFSFACKPTSIWILQLLPFLCTRLIASENFANCKVNTIVWYISKDYIPQDLLEAGRETAVSLTEQFWILVIGVGWRVEVSHGMRVIDIQQLDIHLRQSACIKKMQERWALTSSAEWKSLRRVAGSTSNVLLQVVAMSNKRFMRSSFVGAIVRSYDSSCTQLNVFLRTLQRSTMARSETPSLELDVQWLKKVSQCLHVFH